MAEKDGISHEILMRCAERDLNKEIAQWAGIEKIFNVNPYLFADTGSSGKFVNVPEKIRKFLLSNIGELIIAKNVEKIVTVHHNRCLYYTMLLARLYRIPAEEITPEMEKEHQISDMLKVKGIFEENFSVEVIPVWAQIKKENGKKEKVDFTRIN